MSNYVPPRIASKQLGVSTKTLYRWEEEGKIKTYRTPSGQRRFDIESVINSGIKHGTVVLYARVSSHAQKSDLERQVQFLIFNYPECEVVREVGSGLNFKRKKLQALLVRVFSGDVRSIVVTNKDRLARFGFDLISRVCQQFGCEVLVLNTSNTSPEREMVEDILAIIHVFSCRLYGMRKYKNKIRQDSELPSLSQGRNKEVMDAQSSRQS
jgi:excisionase family DNA binding protein